MTNFQYSNPFLFVIKFSMLLLYPAFFYDVSAPSKQYVIVILVTFRSQKAKKNNQQVLKNTNPIFAFVFQ